MIIQNKMENKDKDKIDFTALWTELSNKIKGAYPYFIIFYALALIASWQFKNWRPFFNWFGMHVLAIIFTVLFLFISGWRFRDSFYDFFSLVKRRIKKFFLFLKNTFILMPRRDKIWLAVKIFIITTSLIYASYQALSTMKLLVLAYALATILFVVDSRLSAGLALFFLISCPILIVIKKGKLVEDSAVYAYYFLIITVLARIKEMWRENRVKNNRGGKCSAA